MPQSLNRISKLGSEERKRSFITYIHVCIYTQYIFVNITWKNLPFGEKCKCFARALSTSRNAFVKTNSRLNSSATRSLKQQPRLHWSEYQIQRYNFFFKIISHCQTFKLLISRLISCDKDWYRYVTTGYLLISLLDVFLHVFFTKVGCFWPTMPIKHSKVEYVVSHLGDLEAVFILLALTNERGTAYFR